MPVEADRRDAAADLVGAEQGGQGLRDAGQNVLTLTGLFALSRLDAFPLFLDVSRRADRLLLPTTQVSALTRVSILGRRHGRLVTEDMGMASDELVDDGLEGVGDVELAFLVAELREEHTLEDQVADLPTECLRIVAIDGVEYLVRLFQNERTER